MIPVPLKFHEFTILPKPTGEHNIITFYVDGMIPNTLCIRQRLFAGTSGYNIITLNAKEELYIAYNVFGV